jgi:hypothetical protein
MYMMKGRSLLGLALCLSLTGCGLSRSNNHLSSGLNRMQDPTTNVTYKGPTKAIQTHNPEKVKEGAFGYVHYTRKPGATNALDSKYIPKVDYQALADITTRLSLTLPTIYDVGTLVTDQYVLIGYKTDNPNREEAAQQVKATALSVVPNYYKVYISDEPNISKEIARFKNFASSMPDVHRWLPAMIKQMKKSPQGTSVNHNTLQSDHAIKRNFIQ